MLCVINMQILAVSNDAPGCDWTGTEALLYREALRVWELQKQALLRSIWFTVPDNNAVLLLECASVDEAQALLATLPLVREGKIVFTCTELAPYTGFDRLFSKA